jgi:hypothetical protein
VPYAPSETMLDLIDLAEDFHCGGCVLGPSASKKILIKYINYILTPGKTRDWHEPIPTNLDPANEIPHH